MKRKSKKFLFLLSQLLLVAAPMLVSIKSIVLWGEPEMPDCLKK